jgi:hypothetical protein
MTSTGETVGGYDHAMSQFPDLVKVARTSVELDVSRLQSRCHCSVITAADEHFASPGSAASSNAAPTSPANNPPVKPPERASACPAESKARRHSPAPEVVGVAVRGRMHECLGHFRARLRFAPPSRPARLGTTTVRCDRRRVQGTTTGKYGTERS